MAVFHVSTKSSLHRKAKAGLVRCDGDYYRVHDMDGFPYTGEVVLQFNGSSLTAHAKSEKSKILYISDV